MPLYSSFDHRGRPVGLSAVLADFPPAISIDSISPAAARRIEEKLRHAFEDPLSAGSMIIVGLSATLAAITVVGLYRGLGLALGYAIGAAAVAQLGVTIAAAAVRRKWNADARASAIVGAFLAEKCCPACGYDLTGAAAEDDGCTVCPECGATWRLSVEPTSAG